MIDSTTLEGGRETVRSEITQVIRHHCERLPAPERADEFALFFDRFAEARVVLLGEATHGTSEFYRARAPITERLVSQHGFAFVAVEADWPDAARIDRYVRPTCSLAATKPGTSAPISRASLDNVKRDAQTANLDGLRRSASRMTQGRADNRQCAWPGPGLPPNVLAQVG